jgi:hypothetical protein
MKRSFITAFGLAGVLVLASGTVGHAQQGSSGNTVDPSTLQPPPPNAVCHESGRQIICDTFVDDNLVNEPISDFDLPCGTIYETSHYHGAGTRWYVNRLVDHRHVAASLEGTWSLSPTGAGPVVRLSGHYSIQTVWTTPGDVSTETDTSISGNDFKLSAPGFGVILLSAGLTDLDGEHHGVTPEFPFTPEVEAALCAALTP